MLQISNLTRRFGEFTAVDGVSFDVKPGMLTGFVGANGAGKTTTMRMIMGLLQIHDGTVSWQGHPVTAGNRASFGYMPEERGLYAKQPVRDQLVYFARLHGLSATQAKADVDGLLERLGLQEKARAKLESLSLGNQQRVQVIAALVADPQALILDEPFSGLDPNAVDDLLVLLREKAAGGVPVLFSSHQLDVVERICDELVILSGGHVAAAGTVDGLRERGRPRHMLILDQDAGWVRDVPGIAVDDVDAKRALLEIVEPGAERALFNQALARGEILEFARVRPTLSDIYKEVSAS